MSFSNREKEFYNQQYQTEIHVSPISSTHSPIVFYSFTGRFYIINLRILFRNFIISLEKIFRNPGSKAYRSFLYRPYHYHYNERVLSTVGCTGVAAKSCKSSLRCSLISILLLFSDRKDGLALTYFSSYISPFNILFISHFQTLATFLLALL